MMILSGLGMLGSFGPIWRVQTRAFFAALEVFLQKQLTLWAQNVIGRAWQGARFTAEMTDADTTVAAGGRQGPALFREIGSLA
jgi:hypothetical protein